MHSNAESSPSLPDKVIAERLGQWLSERHLRAIAPPPSPSRPRHGGVFTKVTTNGTVTALEHAATRSLLLKKLSEDTLDEKLSKSALAYARDWKRLQRSGNRFLKELIRVQKETL